jgi:hypothetical protein
MTENEIKFGLRKITTGQFATIDSVQVYEDAIRLNFGFGFGINEDFRIVGCNAKFEFLSKEVPFIVLNVMCDFEIETESWTNLINTDLKTINLPVPLITHLAVLTVGTARGILHCKTENTAFNKYFLPPLNVTESLKTDIVITSQKL